MIGSFWRKYGMTVTALALSLLSPGAARAQVLSNPEDRYIREPRTESSPGVNQPIFVAVADDEPLPPGGQAVMTSSDGVNWTLRDTPDGWWFQVAYGNGLFAAVSEWQAYNGGSDTQNVMTSPDGVNWTLQTNPLAPPYPSGGWISIAYGNGLYVVGAQDYSDEYPNSIMTSPDGVVWTAQNTPPGLLNAYSIAYGNGLWVAVSETPLGEGQYVLTSPDGVDWTPRNTPANIWRGVSYQHGLFVAVAMNEPGTGQDAMTSPDGINWTVRATPYCSGLGGNGTGIAYGAGLFVVVGNDCVMTSPDGINWFRQNAPDCPWSSVTYAYGLFVAVALGYPGDKGQDVMTSPNGIIWTPRDAPSGPWSSVTSRVASRTR